MSGRRLSEEERTLWSGVIRSVAPLRRTPQPRPTVEDAAGAAPEKSPPKAAGKQQPVAMTPRTAPSAPPPLAPLGRRFRQSLARGTRQIEGRLDLHGLSQAEAHAALLRFLRTGQARGARTVLVITGKGNPGEGHGDRGVLKRQVPMWLRLPEFRNLIVGFEPAGVAHGGAGAMYIRLRRSKGDVTSLL